MKKLFILALLSSVLFSLTAQEGIQFFEGTFEAAKKEAAVKNKLIFMDAYTVWCGPCKRMAKDVFPQKEVGDFFNRNFINIKVDMEKGEGKDIAKKYSIYSYPTLLFIDKDGNVVNQAKGMRNAAGLIDLGKQALLPNPGQISALEARYESGERDNTFLKEYIEIKYTLGDDFEEAFELFIKQLDDTEIVEVETATFIADHTQSIHSPGMKVFEDFAKAYKNVLGENYDKKLTSLAENTIQEAIDNKDLEQLNTALDFLKKNKLENHKEQTLYHQLAFYGKHKMWDDYDKVASKYLKKYKKDDPLVLKNVAWNYYMNISDSKQLNKAVKWIEQAIALDNSFINHMTHAYLLFKLDQYSEAEDAIEYALILSEGKEKNITNAEILRTEVRKKLNKE